MSVKEGNVSDRYQQKPNNLNKPKYESKFQKKNGKPKRLWKNKEIILKYPNHYEIHGYL